MSLRRCSVGALLAIVTFTLPQPTLAEWWDDYGEGSGPGPFLGDGFILDDGEAHAFCRTELGGERRLRLLRTEQGRRQEQLVRQKLAAIEHPKPADTLKARQEAAVEVDLEDVGTRTLWWLCSDTVVVDLLRVRNIPDQGDASDIWLRLEYAERVGDRSNPPDTSQVKWSAIQAHLETSAHFDWLFNLSRGQGERKKSLGVRSLVRGGLKQRVEDRMIDDGLEVVGSGIVHGRSQEPDWNCRTTDAQNQFEIQTDSSHGFLVNDLIMITGHSQNVINGEWLVAQVCSPTVFTVAPTAFTRGVFHGITGGTGGRVIRVEDVSPIQADHIGAKPIRIFSGVGGAVNWFEGIQGEEFSRFYRPSLNITMIGALVKSAIPGQGGSLFKRFLRRAGVEVGWRLEILRLEPADFALDDDAFDGGTEGIFGTYANVFWEAGF